MDLKHTPGPWYYDGHESRTVVADRDGDVECPTICDVLDTTEGLEGDCPQADANGRLIASAPDLLAAAIDAVETFEAGGMPGGPIMHLRAVIRDAIGDPNWTGKK